MAPGARGRDGGGGLSVRLLVVALLIQLALGAGIIFAAVNGFPFIGSHPHDEGDDGAATTAPAVALPPVPKPTRNRFDADRAFRLLKMQVAVGQRPAGSIQLQQLAERLRTMLPGGHFEDVPDHPGLRNVVGQIRGRRPPIIIGAHYDSEYHPKGFVGANDSAAGTAAVIELARDIQKMHRPHDARSLRFVLYDGEEEPPGCPPDQFFDCALRGSKADAAVNGRTKTKAMILLDYVANKGLRLPRERSSDENLWEMLRDAATTVGEGDVFPDTVSSFTILDDHTPYLRAGVPAIDLIDFTYRYRDTVKDTVDKTSPRSLDAVGESIIQLIRQLDASRF